MLQEVIDSLNLIEMLNFQAYWNNILKFLPGFHEKSKNFE